MQSLTESDARARREAIRPLPVPGTWAYVDRLNVEPGSAVRVHVSAPAAHQIQLVRLGLDAVIDPSQSLDDDREQATVLASVERPASPQTIDPGSYVHVGGAPIPPGETSMGLWVRLWKVPVVDVVQVAWQGLITDIDYPEAARIGLLIDHLGRVGAYAGDGGAFRHEWLHMSPPIFAKRLDQWTHVAASWSAEAIRLFID